MEPVFAFDLELDRAASGTLARSLHRQLRAAILDGRLAAGTRLPATRRAALALGLARNTVVAAYDLLIAEGHLLARTNAAPVVSELSTRRPHGAVKPRPQGDERIAAAWKTRHLQSPGRLTLPERCFRVGVPDHQHFPFDVWRRLTARQLRAWSKRPFAYPPSEGLPELRQAIARHVAFSRAVVCNGDDIVVTSGAGQAFDLLARLLVTPGRTCVAVENPGYPPVRAAFAAAGAQLAAVPVDDEGLCVDRLPEKARVICVTPSHQSPTGVAMSMRRRQALLAFARARGAVIIEDDYDGEFRFGSRPLDALQTLDRDAGVFYVGTFSKSLFPAVRKGFVVAPPWALDALKYVKHSADSHGDALAQEVLAAFIDEGHLARHVRRMQPLYAARREALLSGLKRDLARWLEPIPSEAGLHLCARIRTASQARKVLSAAAACTPGAQSAADYAMGSLEHPALTIGYGVIDAEAIPIAIARMRRALEAR
jgi:GntR family transcriptional regulator/MocR family aminotransferase